MRLERLAGATPDGEQQSACLLLDAQLAEGVTHQARAVADLDLLDPEVEVLVVHHDVEELRDVRLEGEHGHPPTADALRVDRPAGPGQQHLRLGIGGARSRDDHQVRSDGSRRQGDVDGVGVGVESGDQCSGSVDAGGPQHGVVGDVAAQVVGEAVAELLETTGVVVDDHDLVAARGQELRGRAPDPPVTADDHVPAHGGDVLVHAASLQMLAEVALGDRLEDDTEVVQNRADAEHDQHHREDLADRREWPHLSVADRGDGGDGLVQRFQGREPEQQVAHGPEDRHGGQREQGSLDPPQTLHPSSQPHQLRGNHGPWAPSLGSRGATVRVAGAGYGRIRVSGGPHVLAKPRR